MPHIHHQTMCNPLLIAGREIRTTNTAELSGSGQIGLLWHNFFADNLAGSIPNRIGNAIYAVYSNYESDENGAYSLLVGVPVSTAEGLPAGITFVAIPTGEYAVMTTEKGQVAEQVYAAWKAIWSLSSEELGGRRAFLTDYEIYDERANNPSNAIVEIHVGVKPHIPLR